jgi:hypothetical protein
LKREPYPMMVLMTPTPKGLDWRGNGALWNAMRTAFKGVWMSGTGAGLIAQIEVAFERLTDHRMCEAEPFSDDRHYVGGPFGCIIRPDVWRNVILPELLNRQAEALSDAGRDIQLRLPIPSPPRQGSFDF